MTKPYEHPTDDLRQVKRPIKRGNGVLGPGYRDDVIGYDVTIQRRWIVYSSRRLIRFNEPAPGCRVETDEKGNWWAYDGTEEWRDLPTIWTEKPKARPQSL